LTWATLYIEIAGIANSQSQAFMKNGKCTSRPTGKFGNAQGYIDFLSKDVSHNKSKSASAPSVIDRHFSYQQWTNGSCAC
jgi:hypothetical protein